MSICIPEINFIGTTADIGFHFGKFSVRVICPHCHKSVQTVVEANPTCATHVLAFFMCFIFPALCILPYFFDDMLEHEHFCPVCGLFLGSDQQILH